MKIAMFQPDIPQNVGAMIRLCACVGADLEIIEPCGFPWNEARIKQSALDYLTMVKVTRHATWEEFRQSHKGERIILMTTKTDKNYVDFEFQENDILLAGQESKGAPDFIHESVDARLSIPMNKDARSLNIVNATSMIVGEVMRQTEWK